MPTTRLELFVAPGARLLNEPVAVSPDVAVLMDAFKPSPTWIVFWIVNACEGAAAPTRTLPRLTGFGVAALAAARVPTLAWMRPLTGTR